ncbi:MAG: aminotransferase class V-fold PLP-dependent enzyme [Methanomicrobiales archaeon]|jgi:cysteine desulfurase/selenocysteine lyase|nr:aminotransferase class V-fold PLP-dependent enzyme [Methanomicrobiales archaeon]
MNDTQKRGIKQEPQIKKVLYWCEECNIPLIAKTCSCKTQGISIPIPEPHEIRPALAFDHALITRLCEERFGTSPLAHIILLAKIGGVDRTEAVIMNGRRCAILAFDPVSREYTLSINVEALPFLLPHATRGIVTIQKDHEKKRRIGGKKVEVQTNEPEGSVIVKYGNQYGTGVLRDGYVRVHELVTVQPISFKNPHWEEVISKNTFHLKNLERQAIRDIKYHIKQHAKNRPAVNVSFSGGKDSTAVLELARKAGVTSAFFIDTGLEFPETLEFVAKQGVTMVPPGGDFWSAVQKAGPPAKDNRWCCKLLKLFPLKRYLETIGPCLTIQGNRWYESWNRSGIDITTQNPANPLQLNLSPIRHWRAFEVFLYIWWQEIPYSSLYDMGFERIGCYLCPAMLEAEYELMRVTHPKMTERWDTCLLEEAEKRGYSDAYVSYGLWRWKELPAKMKELCEREGVSKMQKVTDVKQQISRAPMESVKQITPLASSPFDAARGDFFLLSDLIYLDSASTSLSPESVIAAMIEYEHFYRANVGRGVHRLSQIATQRYWHAHEKVAQFIGGKKGTTVFTKNCTEAITTVARGLNLGQGDHIITTLFEHHSNLLPWKELEKKGVKVEIIPMTSEFLLDMDALSRACTKDTKLISVCHVSNVFGSILPVEKIAALCREHNILFLVDGAQSVPHLPVDVQQIGCDFFCFSGHKMLGPTGTGVLWIREGTPPLNPLMIGGGTVEHLSHEGYTLLSNYERYEAGTPNISGGIGLGAAIDYLKRFGMEAVRAHEQILSNALINGLKEIQGVTVYAPSDLTQHTSVISFTVDGYHPHEVAQYLDEQADIMVRSGHHCCMPAMEYLGISGTVRASLHLYSSMSDVQALIAGIKELVRGQ